MYILAHEVAGAHWARTRQEQYWASLGVPERQPYWAGYDCFVECALAHDYLSPEDFAAMTPEEKRGYEFAQRCAADTESYAYLSNRNAYGDLTEF